MTMPLSARRLWLIHISTVILSGLAILATADGVVIIGNLLQGRRPLLEPGLVSLSIHLGAGMALALAVLQISKPSLCEIRLTKGYIILVVAVVFGFLGLVTLLSAFPRLYALIPLGIAVILGVRTYRALPGAFTLVRLRADQDGGMVSYDPQEVQGRRPSSLWFLHSIIWRNPFGHLTWIYVPAFAFYGAFLAFTVSVIGPSGSRVPWLFFTWFMLVCWSLASMNKLYTLDALPISRKRIFAVLVLPPLLILGISYGLGSIVGPFIDDPARQVDFRMASADCYYIHIPNEFWRVSWDGQLPPEGSPGFECCGAIGHPIFRGSSILVYKPYGVPRDGTPDLIAAQISLAVGEIYGRSLPHEEIKDRYLETSEEGGVRLKEGGFTLLDDYPGLKIPGRGRLFPFIILLVGLAWLIIMALMYRVNRSNVTVGLRKYLSPGIFFFPVLLGVVMFIADAMDLVDTMAIWRLAEILIRRLGETIPGGTVSIWCISALLLSGGYWLAQTQFSRMELSVGVSKKSW